MVANELMHVNMLICYWKVNIVLPLSSLRKTSPQPTLQAAEDV